MPWNTIAPLAVLRPPPSRRGPVPWMDMPVRGLISRLGEDGVAGAGLKGAPGGVAAGDGLHVAVTRCRPRRSSGSSVPSILYRWGRLGAPAAGAAPGGARGLGAHLAGVGGRPRTWLDALAVAVPKGALEVDGAVVVPEAGRGRCRAWSTVDGVGPGARGCPSARDVEVARHGADVGGDHVEHARRGGGWSARRCRRRAGSLPQRESWLARG